MNSLTQLPDLAAPFRKMKIMDRLEMKLINSQVMPGMFILNAIQQRTSSTNEILRTIKEMAEDNLPAMQKLIGEDLLQDIISL